jgi:bifunctional DNase/RNase
MTLDEQEAHSLRYSRAAFWVLPLGSGNIAVLTPRRDLFAIVKTWEEAKTVGPNAEQPKPPRYLSHLVLTEEDLI